MIKQYQLVNTWKRRCGIQTDISLLAGDLPELKRAQGTEGAEQSSAGTARGRACLAPCAGAPPAEGPAGALLGAVNAVPHCANRNLSTALNSPSNVSIPRGIGEVCVFVIMFKKIVGQLES